MRSPPIFPGQDGRARFANVFHKWLAYYVSIDICEFDRLVCSYLHLNLLSAILFDKIHHYPHTTYSLALLW